MRAKDRGPDNPNTLSQKHLYVFFNLFYIKAWLSVKFHNAEF